MPIKRLFLSLIVGLGLIPVLVGLLVTLGAGISQSSVAHAAGFLYVAPAGNDPGNDCRASDKPCATVQHAVDVAAPGDEIHVAAGIYTDLHPKTVSGKTVTQVVYISRTVVIRGGYSDDFSIWDPSSHSTVLDAQGWGRVIYITGDITATVEGLRIISGSAAGLGGGSSGEAAGGGVYVIGATTIISNSEVFSNSADLGGGLFLLSSTATLTSNIIATNTAYGPGGGLFLSHSTARLDDNEIISNTAYDVGGGLRLITRSTATLNGNQIISNTALRGGGLHLNASVITLTGNEISSNRAGEGGGLFVYSYSLATLSGNNFISNTADSRGGGLRLAEDSVATLSGDTIAANRAITGGGVYLDGSSTTTLTNIFIVDNQAITGRGAGLLVADSSARLLHVTIARNHDGDGSGVYVTERTDQRGITRHSTVALTNTILVSHTVGISVTSGNTATVNGVLWYDTPFTVSQAATAVVTVTNPHEGDPAFVKPDAGDYHIGPTSEARDKGEKEGCIALDWDGEARPVGLGCDLGADEFLAVLSLAKQASPDPVQVGEQLTYTVRLTNASHIPLHATLTDTLPADVTYNGVLTWGPVTLAAGGVWTAEVGVRVNQDARGALTNVVEAASAEGAAGVHIVTSTVLRPSLQVTKEVSPRVADVGETVTYLYTLTNTGDVTLNDLRVGDNLLGVITPATTVLGPGQTTSGMVAYVVRQGDLPGPLVNTMTVTGTPPMGNPVTATGMASVTLISHPAIQVAKDANVSTANVGETITYLFTLTNTGDVTLSIVASDNRLGPIPLGADSLAPGEVTTGSATHTAVDGDRPLISNTVTVTGTSLLTGQVTASASESVTVTHPCWPVTGVALAVVLTCYALRRKR